MDLGGPVRMLAKGPTPWIYAATTGAGDAVVIDARNGSIRSRMRSDIAPYAAVAWFADGERLALARDDGGLEITSLEGGCSAAVDGDGVGLACVEVSDDGALLVTGTGFPENGPDRYDGWRLCSLGLVHLWSLPSARAYAVRFIPGSHRAILSRSAGGVQELVVANAETGDVESCLGAHEERIYDIALSPDAQFVATVSWDRTMSLWSTASAPGVQPKALFTVPHRGDLGTHLSAATLVFDSSGEWLFSGGTDKCLYAWDCARAKRAVSWPSDRIRTRPDPWPPPVVAAQQRWGHRDRVTGIETLPDGRLLSSSLDGSLRTWKRDSNPGAQRMPHPWWVTGISFSPDGREVATSCRDGIVRVLDTATSTESRFFELVTGHAWAVDWSPDGRWLAVADASYPTGRAHSTPKDVFVVDAHSGDVRWRLIGHSSDVLAVEFSPDGRLLASSAEDGRAILWSLETGESLRVLAGHEDPRVNNVSFSPDGTKLLTACFDHKVRMWDVASGDLLRVFSAHEYPVRAARWSPDGTRIASCAAEYDRSVRTSTYIWNAESGEVELELVGHELGVLALDWAPNGRRLATSDEHGKVKLWDTSNGDNVLTLRETEAWIADVTWSPDGSRLAAGGADEVLRIWSTP